MRPRLAAAARFKRDRGARRCALSSVSRAPGPACPYAPGLLMLPLCCLSGCHSLPIALACRDEGHGPPEQFGDHRVKRAIERGVLRLAGLIERGPDGRDAHLLTHRGYL